MDFDPDAFLAEEFDPDAFLAGGPVEPPVQQEMPEFANFGEFRQFTTSLPDDDPRKPALQERLTARQAEIDADKNIFEKGIDKFADVTGLGKVSEGVQKLQSKISSATPEPPKALSEFSAGSLRAPANFVDMMTVDLANDIKQRMGFEPDIPTLKAVLGKLGGNENLQGGYMEPGLARDIVSTSGELSTIGLGVGSMLRNAAAKAPALTGSSSTGQGVLKQLGSSTPAQDLIYADLAAVGSEVGEEVGGEKGKVVGGLVTPVAVSAAAQGLKGSIRQIFRGGESGRKIVAQNIDDFAVSGSTPTVGEATERGGFMAAENISSKFIGGRRINEVRQKTSNNIKKRIAAIADEVSTRSGDDIAGLTIKKGITGQGGFLDRFKIKSGELWKGVDGAIGESTEVSISSTRKALGDMVKTSDVGKTLNNPVLTKLNGAIGESQSVNYAVLRELRSQIGAKISSKELVTDIPRAELKRLYGAITKDIEVAAKSAGVDKEFSRANTYTSAGHKRLGDFVESIVTKADRDKIFAAVSRGSEGAQVVNSIKRSLKPEEWEVVASNIIRKMGQSTSGQQGADTAEFSVQKFLTDWNKLGKAKSAMFSGSDKLNAYRRNLDSIARSAERIKFSGQEAANPSGSGQFIANMSTATAGGGAIATGNTPVLATVLTTITANNLGARLMTNPKFVAALARSTSRPTVNMPVVLSTLSAAAENSEIDDAIAIHSLIEQIQSEMGQRETN